jgi:hypothetical protein
VYNLNSDVIFSSERRHNSRAKKNQNKIEKLGSEALKWRTNREGMNMGATGADTVQMQPNMGNLLIILVEWTRDYLRQMPMDAMMMLLAKRDTTDLAGLWLSNILAHCLVLHK